jgi:uncharacterized protein (DUF305 family)
MKDTIMRKLSILLSAAMLLSGATAALAQDAVPAACQGGHTGHGAAVATDTSGMNDVQKAYVAAFDKMHPPMMAGVMAEDPDVAFVCGMIPHHQGAIDMAKIVLEHGKDPWVKQLARNVIDAQTREIAEMTKWLQEHAR